MNYDDIIDLGLNRGDPIKFTLFGRWTSSEEITGTFGSISISKTYFRYEASGGNFETPIEKIDNLVKMTETSN